MSKQSPWATERAAEVLTERTLESCPPLIPYMYEGARVLDVGCGPGTITVSVAVVVAPGSVVGVDAVAQQIDRARSHAAESGVDNVEFMVGDAYSLDFPDDTFDVTYCHAMLEYIADPVQALKEQARVTKSGGRVITGGIASDFRYPACPAVEKVRVEAFAHLNDPSDPERFLNLRQGRMLIARYLEAGIRDLNIETYITAGAYSYAGMEGFENAGRVDRVFLDAEGPFKDRLQKLKDLGVLTDQMLDDARAEIDQWKAHPHAFRFAPRIFVAGSVE